MVAIILIEMKRVKGTMTQDSQAIAAEYRGYAEAFQDQSVVEAYQYRPPYPDATFDI